MISGGKEREKRAGQVSLKMCVKAQMEKLSAWHFQILCTRSTLLLGGDHIRSVKFFFPAILLFFSCCVLFPCCLAVIKEGS